MQRKQLLQQREKLTTQQLKPIAFAGAGTKKNMFSEQRANMKHYERLCQTYCGESQQYCAVFKHTACK